MNPAVRLKQIILVLGDVAILYAALALTLIIRYQEPFSPITINSHLEPFSILFVVWVLIFYINGLYEIGRLKNTLAFLKNISGAIMVATLISIIFFYFITNYGIAPKTNLFIFLIIVFFSIYAWRGLYNNAVGRHMPMTKIAFIGITPISEEIIKNIKENPQQGYTIIEDIDSAELIIIPARLKQDARTRTILYHYATAGVAVMDTTTFYELIFSKLPISELEDTWFVHYLANRHTIYDFFRLPVEIFFATLLLILTLPLTLLIGFVIKLTSTGPAIFKQTRVGELGAPFILYKFRSMIANAPDGSAEGNGGPQWKTTNDSRFTWIGRVIEKMHIDELPQLVNIIKGDVSFVGPRPERPTFTAQLKEQIPYYELRQLVKPGITGWAQLHYGYGASVQDAYTKLQYDLYYLKNQSFWLDLGIIIKTIKLFFAKP